MNKLFAIFLVSTLPFFAFSQGKSKEKYVFQEIKTVEVDGDLADWSLCRDSSSLWSFGIGKQQNYLCVAVRMKDESLQLEALRSGIFVDVSYSEKKKSGARITFPFVDGEKRRALLNQENLSKDNLKNELLNSVRGYHISGFEKIINGLLSLENHYGIRAVVRLDEKEGMIYEAKIPLELIKFQSENISVHIGVNTNYMLQQQMNKQMHRPTTRSMVYGRAPVTKKMVNPYGEETSVWVSGKIK